MRSSGNTLDATALVHDADLRLVGHSVADRNHLLAAAEVVRNILIDRTRIKRGGASRIDVRHVPVFDLPPVRPRLDVIQTFIRPTLPRNYATILEHGSWRKNLRPMACCSAPRRQLPSIVMSEVTRLLEAAAGGDPTAADVLLPLVYDELRALAAARLANEQPGQTLQPTALVHEAYIRLVGGGQADGWNGRGHFFAAAAEAMRRILIEAARRKARIKHGGGIRWVPLDSDEPASVSSIDLLALDDALKQLEANHRRSAELVKLRYFAGHTLPEAADILGVSRATAEDDWAYAKAWLARELGKS